MRRGGLVVVALVIAAGIFRFVSPTGLGNSEGTAVPASPKQAEGPKKSDAQSLLNTVLKGAAYDERLKGTIQGFFGFECDSEPQRKNFNTHWNVPPNLRNQVRFLIAFFPDPKHTRLGLFLDRGVEALQQAAQDEGYEFDRAIMPWNAGESSDSGDFVAQLLQAKMEAESEKYPGLLIFREGGERLRPRESKDSNGHAFRGRKPAEDRNHCEGQGSSDREPLFVFVVGEKPTAGINKEQFANALKIISDIRGRNEKQNPEPPLLVLGPTSSGSFYSLVEALKINHAHLPSNGAFVFSGIARSTSAREWFIKHKPDNVRYFSAQENEGAVLRQFAKFVGNSLGIDNHEVVVLSEDETSYGKAQLSGDDRMTGVNSLGSLLGNLVDEDRDARPSVERDAGEGQWREFQFPRGISQFRSAYQKEFGSSAQAQEVVVQGRAVLRLDLDARGEDDSIPIFAKSQMPLSQEAVMLQIIAALRQPPSPKLVVLRATDPLDQLFLARYLRTHYPEGRIVVVEPDLLLAREQDGLLAGTTSISSYPLVLRQEGVLYQVFQDAERLGPNSGSQKPLGGLERIFASASAAGTYNAMLALLKESNRCDSDLDSCTRDLSRTGVIPTRYYGYASPFFATFKSGRRAYLKPGLWVSMLGRDGFWAVQAFEPDAKKSTLEPINANPVPVNAQFPRPPRAWLAAYVVFLLFLVTHAAFLWKGSILSRFEALAIYGVVESSSRPDSEGEEIFTDRRRRAIILALGTLFLGAGLLFLLCAWLGTRQSGDEWLRVCWIAFPFVPPVLGAVLSLAALWIRHRERLVAGVAAVVLAALLVLALFPRWWFPGTESLLVTRRILWLTSGVSPVPPVLFLLLMGLCAAWFELRGMALVDVRRPRLPIGNTAGELDRMDDAQAEKIRVSMRPLTLQWRVAIPAALVVYLLSFGLNWTVRRPVHTLEGPTFDHIYGALFWTAVLVFIGCTFKMFASWAECRVMLFALDRIPLRDAFKRLKEFSWGPLWSLGGSALRDSYKFLSRQLECLAHLEAGLEKERAQMSKESYEVLHDQIEHAKSWRSLVFAYYEEAKTDEARIPDLMETYALLQKELARLTTLVYRQALIPQWLQDDLPVSSAFPKKMAKARSGFELVAEEYVSLAYANFLVTVLLRMRTMVLCAIGMYVLILLSISSYPFSPSPATFLVAVSLILLLVSVIGIVYAQMHREATLSRLTDTPEGELGTDFWLQFVSAGAIPILTLLASQFPEISRIANSFLQPLMQSVK